MERVITDYDLERERYDALYTSLRTHLGTRWAGGGAPADLVASWVESYLRDPATRERGRVLTDLMRLGTETWQQIATIIKGIASPVDEVLQPELRGRYGLHIYCRALRPVEIETHAKRIVKARSERTGAPLRWDDRPVITRLAPGDVIDLDIHHAVVSLRLGTWRCHHPNLWESSGAIPTEESLIEVAYSSDVLGIDTRATEPRKRGTS